MIFTTAILKEVKIMNNIPSQTRQLLTSIGEKTGRFFSSLSGRKRQQYDDVVMRPFNVIMNKEISDHVRSWRFIILIGIIALTCLGSMYTALTNMNNAVKPNDPAGSFFFLKLFTISDGTLPSYFVFISFLGPLLGISLGFDAVNSEHNKGTLSRILSQPIHRDYLLNAKLMGALFVISVMFFALSFLVLGLGLITIGIPPTAEEFLRVVFFTILSIIYVAFWLNLSILFSVLFRQPATSALAGIAVWLFFSVFYGMIINLITKGMAPPEMTATPHQIVSFEHFRLSLLRVMPNQLFSEGTQTLLMPSVRSLGPLTMEQVYGALPGPLPLGQSLLLVWPQVTGLIAATIICFVISYIYFMRREIRSR
jgi:ABC-2 type transport system permease protein